MNIIYYLYYIVLLTHSAYGDRFIPIIPEECKEQTICEEVPNYPHEYVKQVLDDLEKQGLQWRIEVEKGKENLPSESEDQKDKDMCPSNKETAIPFAARDKLGRWRFVINTKGVVPQPVQIETCEAVNSSCTYNDGTSSGKVTAFDGYTASCQQKKLYTVLSCLDEEGKLLDVSIPIINSCCTCSVKKL